MGVAVEALIPHLEGDHAHLGAFNSIPTEGHIVSPLRVFCTEMSGNAYFNSKLGHFS